MIEAGTVSELWRYPVKSMLGERREQLLVTSQGCLGDRAWALRGDDDRVASAKKHPRLLEFQATFIVEPGPDDPGQVEIETPSGRKIRPEDPAASTIISEIVGRPLRLENRARPHDKTGIDRATVFGGVPVHQMKPDWTSETMPDYFELKANTFLEIGAIYLLASGSVSHVSALQGRATDRRRFRPNIYIASTATAGFVEDAWIGSRLAIGAMVCDELAATLWCVTSTLAQRDLPRDLGVLRTLAERHGGCLGVYASVTTAGVVRVGDRVLQMPPA